MGNLKGKRITAIINILDRHPEGLTIEDLSKSLKAHRQTVTKYILELANADIIHRRRIGTVTLQYLKERFFENLNGRICKK